MTDESFSYVAERIREAVATGPAGQLGISVGGDEDRIILSGPVDSEEARTIAVRTARSLGGRRHVVDDLEVAPVDSGIRPAEQL